LSVKPSFHKHALCVQTLKFEAPLKKIMTDLLYQ